MSPTYQTATRIISAAREHGWSFIPGVVSQRATPWGCRKTIHRKAEAGPRYDFQEHRRVMLLENRRGGLVWVRTFVSVDGETDVEYFGPRFANKLDVVLDFLSNL